MKLPRSGFALWGGDSTSRNVSSLRSQQRGGNHRNAVLSVIRFFFDADDQTDVQSTPHEPQAMGNELLKLRIPTDHCQVSPYRLPDKHPVKWIEMCIFRELSIGKGFLRRKTDQLKPDLFRQFDQTIHRHTTKVDFSQSCLDRNLRQIDCTYENVISRIPQFVPCPFRNRIGLRNRPDERVGIQQVFHRNPASSSSVILKSSANVIVTLPSRMPSVRSAFSSGAT